MLQPLYSMTCLILTDIKNSFTVNLFLPSKTSIHLANDFQTWKALNVAINTLFCCLEKWYHLSNITRNLELIFSFVQNDCSSRWISDLSHSMNTWPDTHGFWVDRPYTGSRHLRNTVNDINSQQVNDNLLHANIFINIATWHSIVVCSFAIVNPGSIFFSLYMYVPIGTLFQASQFHLCRTATIFNHFS